VTAIKFDTRQVQMGFECVKQIQPDSLPTALFLPVVEMMEYRTPANGILAPKCSVRGNSHHWQPVLIR
jgi:hypothetical protein